MSAWVVASLVGVGVLVGFVAGLIGIGGGVLVVPFLYFFYGHPGWSGVESAPDVRTAVAHATSLFVILPTALMGLRAYHRDRVVSWRAALPIAIASTFAAAGGARIAVLLPPAMLRLGFGILLLASGTQLMLRRRHAHPQGERHSLVPGIVTGVLVGLLSALMGVGGGIIAIPLLIYWVRLDETRVAATSLAVVSFAAAAGTASYIAGGWSAAGLPPGSAGYVHLPAGVAILAGSMLAVSWGVRLNRRLGATALRRIFGIVFLLLGLRMILENTGAL